AGEYPDWKGYEMGMYAQRLGGREPDDKGQYGIAVRWFTPNGSELCFYHINYHSRLPVVSGVIGESASDMPEYFIEFPEDIKLYGISFATRSEEHTSELQSRENLVCRLLLEQKQYTNDRNAAS